MASRYRSICTPASRIFKSMATPSPKPTPAPSFTPRLSLTTLSRSSSRRGCVQSLLPLQSAVSSARLTSCDSKGTRSLSQPLQTREFGIFSSRRLLTGPSMTLAAVASTKAIPPSYAFCISRLGGYRNSYFMTHPLAHANKDDEFTPTVREAIKIAKEHTIRRQLKYIEPECLMIALLRPEQCIAKDVLVAVNCDINLLKRKMHLFLLLQPKTTDYWLLKRIKNTVLGKYYRFVLNRGWLAEVPKGSSVRESFISNNPESHLHPLFAEANTQRANMGDNLIGEEHLVIAYSSEIRFGTHLFEEMYLIEDDLKSAVQAIRSNLKKRKEDHPKEEEITLTGMEEKTGRC